MPTLHQYRHDLARRAGMLKEITTGVLYNGAYEGTASGTDAARRVVSSDLAASDRAGTEAGQHASMANYAWIYISSTGEQRRIVERGFNSHATASTVLTGQNASADSYIVGYYTVDRAFSTTLAADTDVEVLSTFPVLSNETLPGLHWAINEALQVIPWPMKISITGVSDQSRYDVAATMPWLKHTSQLIRVFRPEDDAARGPDPMRGPAYIEHDGEKTYLEIPEPVNTGETFTVQVLRPASTWIRVNGTWADSTVGLVSNSNEALPEIDHVTTVAYAILARQMARKGPKPQSEEWAKEADMAEETARPYLRTHLMPSTPRRDWSWRTPLHPAGRSWRATVGLRRWP